MRLLGNRHASFASPSPSFLHLWHQPRGPPGAPGLTSALRLGGRCLPCRPSSLLCPLGQLLTFLRERPHTHLGWKAWHTSVSVSPTTSCHKNVCLPWRALEVLKEDLTPFRFPRAPYVLHRHLLGGFFHLSNHPSVPSTDIY